MSERHGPHDQNKTPHDGFPLRHGAQSNQGNNRMENKHDTKIHDCQGSGSRLRTTFRKVKCLAAEAPKSAITRVFCEGHEDDADTLYDGGKVVIEGNGLAGATECMFTATDKAGGKHDMIHVHTDPDFTATDTLVTIDATMLITRMRDKCGEAGSSLDLDAGATIKLTLSDGTELTRHVSFGE